MTLNCVGSFKFNNTDEIAIKTGNSKCCLGLLWFNVFRILFGDQVFLFITGKKRTVYMYLCIVINNIICSPQCFKFSMQCCVVWPRGDGPLILVPFWMAVVSYASSILSHHFWKESYSSFHVFRCSMNFLHIKLLTKDI